MSVFDNKESVFFVGGLGNKTGSANAGGCTKEFLDANGGESAFDLSTIMGPDGEPIVTDLGGTYDTAEGEIIASVPGAFTNVETGMIANVIGEGDFVDGRYEVTKLDNDTVGIPISLSTGDVDVDVYVGGAFDTLDNARQSVTATAFNCWIYSNKDETLAGTHSVSGSGNKELNTRLSIIFFKSVLSDIFPGGANYQSVEDADRNGIDPAKNVILDGDGGAFDVFTLSQDFLSFYNVTVVNSTANAFCDSGTPTGPLFVNCKCYDVERGLFLANTSNPQAINCWLDTNGRSIDFTNYGIVYSCTANSPVAGAIFLKNGTVGINCIINGSLIPVQLANGHLVNSTCYGSSSVSVYAVTGGHNSVRGCILMPQPGAIAAIYNDTALGNTCDVDYNCYRYTDGTEIPNPLDTGTPSGSPPEMGRNDLEVDPQFADAANKDYRLLPGSPCLNTGMPDPASGYSSMGAWQQKQRGSRLGAIHV